MLLLAAVALAAVLIGVVVVTITKVVRDDDSSSQRTDTTQRTGGGVVQAIGPVRGEAVPAYVAERVEALDKARGNRVAVVSLGAYGTEADARGVVGKDPEVLALLVAAPGGGPEVVTGPLSTWATGAVRDARSLRKGVEELLPTVDDPEYASFYRDELVRLDRLAGELAPTDRWCTAWSYADRRRRCRSWRRRRACAWSTSAAPPRRVSTPSTPASGRRSRSAPASPTSVPDLALALPHEHRR